MADRLRRDDVRLLTLTGPGGVGKTRLAIKVSETVAPRFPDGIWFAPLAPVRDPNIIPLAIARSLGMQETGERPIMEGIAAFLAGRRGLLVLDNFEHVLDAAPLVTDLLAACPTLSILVTSRARLRLSGEHEIAVPPLSLLSRDHQGPTGRHESDSLLDSSEAARLFVERATAVDASFALNDSNAADVLALCTRLDGLPLAIELAAARASSLPMPVMLRRLHQGLQLLIGGPRDQPVRLRTMRDAIAWSYDLLSPEEQAVFRRLAVFVGGCSLEAAEAVAVVPSALDIEIIDGVASLTDKSLLRQEPGADGEPRYLMLETVREFALERLLACGEEESVRRAHSAYCVALAEAADPHLIVPGQEVWLARLEADHDNFRAAIAWLDERGDAEEHLRLAGALRNLWLLHSHYVEGRSRLERALESVPAAQPVWRARALAGASLLAMYQGDQGMAQRYRTESMMLWHQVGDKAEVARLQLAAGVSVAIKGEGGLHRAKAETVAALAAFQALGETMLVARPLASMALSNLGDFVGRQGDLASAVRLCTEALALQRELGYTWGAVISLARLGDLAQRMGDTPRAAAAYRESLELSRALWDQRVIAWALFGLARVVTPTHPERAARLMGTVEQWITITGVTPGATSTTTYRDAAEKIARTGLDDKAFAAAWTAGAALTPRLAIDEALELAAAISPPPAHAASHGTTTVTGLTPRELEVLRLVAAGHSNRDIAGMLVISVSTVKRHLSTILGKLELSSRSAATAYAHTHHLV